MIKKLMPKDGKSLDLEEQNIEQLKQLFPDVFSEGKIDFKALKAVLGEHVEDNEERYNFTWHGKNKARQIAQTPSTGTLRPCKEESVNWDTTQNLFIEGDNLEVLKLLQKSYHQKVKMIYIDPPYNTGKDFVYKDNFHSNLSNYLELTSQIDNEGSCFSVNSDSSGRYHTSWLNMMYPRLKLARNLLKDDGVLFISIDDNEINNLMNIVNEIFGEENVELYIWDTREEGTMPKTAKKTVRKEHEYLVTAFKKKELINLNKYASYKYKDNTDWTNPDNDPRGAWMSGNISRGTGASTGGSKSFKVTNPEGITFDRDWSISEEEFNEMLADNRIYFANEGKGVPRKKIFQNESVESIQSSIFENLKSSQSAKKLISQMIEDSNFDYPKPVDLIKRLCQLGTKNDNSDIVMDFFAGTGSTAHAVMELNNEDSGNRKYIAVQLPELATKSDKFNTIADMAKARIKKSAINLKSNCGVKVLKLDETNINQWEPSFDNLSDILDGSVDSIKAERTSEDVLYEILLKYGLDLTYPITEHTLADKTVYDVAFGSLIVCLDDGITRDVVEGIGKLKQELDSETTRVVFKDAGFADDSVKVNAIQMLKQYGVDDVKSI